MTGQQVKIGIVGLGNMGSKHAQHLIDLPNTELAAICDRRPDRLELDAVPDDVPRFSDYQRMLGESALDAVIIATPHFDHPDMTLAAFERGLHVLVEKPIAVHVNEAQRMIDGYRAARRRQTGLVFAAMFMQRTWGQWTAIKALIDAGELGRLQRCSWIITDWFRAQSYYDSGDWRATWQGEGGGVLMNQCPHNVDLFQWFVGMPARVRGFLSFGKHHRIEVEDEVTAYLEYDNGMIGHLITSTGESPGSNRLEIVGENGKLIYENEELHFFRNAWSSIKQIRESDKGFDKVPCARETVAYEPRQTHGHEHIIENFADAILEGAPLIAPAEEGINSVAISNAIVLSAQKNESVALPLNGDEFADLLARYIASPPAAEIDS